MQFDRPAIVSLVASTAERQQKTPDKPEPNGAVIKACVEEATEDITHLPAKGRRQDNPAIARRAPR
jgi:hypothetical protein